MEDSFRQLLLSHGVSSHSINCLEEEGIISEAIFLSLKEEHIMKLLDRSATLKIGQHAILLETWVNLVQSINTKVYGSQYFEYI